MEDSSIRIILQLDGVKSGSVPRCGGGRGGIQGRKERKLGKSEVLKSEVTQSCPTLCDPVDCNPPGFSIHGILQAGILEWITISFSRGSSRPRDRTWVSRIGGRRFNL